MRSLVQIVVLIGLAYAAILTLVYVFQSRLLYLPNVAGRGLAATPQVIGLPYENVHLETSDGVRLHGWLIATPGTRQVLLFFHGNAGNISHRLDSIAIFSRLGLNVLLIDYRGYGLREGKPSEEGTDLDAEAAWRYLVESRGFDPAQIVVFGRSLGGAVAVKLALRHRPAALIIESTFTSVPDMAAAVYPYFPARWLARIHYNSAELVGEVSCPVLVIHSRDDEIIPFAQGRALFEKASEPKSFLELRGGHNEGFLVSRALYVEGLRRFLYPLRETWE